MPIELSENVVGRLRELSQGHPITGNIRPEYELIAAKAAACEDYRKALVTALETHGLRRTSAMPPVLKAHLEQVPYDGLAILSDIQLASLLLGPPSLNTLGNLVVKTPTRASEPELVHALKDWYGKDVGLDMTTVRKVRRTLGQKEPKGDSTARLLHQKFYVGLYHIEADLDE